MKRKGKGKCEGEEKQYLNINCSGFAPEQFECAELLRESLRRMDPWGEEEAVLPSEVCPVLP